MNQVKFTTGGLMVLVTLFAADYVIVSGITGITLPQARIGLFGALPMVHGLALHLILLAVRFRRQGEIGLPGGVFLLVGGIGVLVLGVIAGSAPLVLDLYVDSTGGLWTRPGQARGAIYDFGTDGIDPLLTLLVFVAMTPLLVIPALLAARAARGYRLGLEKSDDRGGTP